MPFTCNFLGSIGVVFLANDSPQPWLLYFHRSPTETTLAMKRLLLCCCFLFSVLSLCAFQGKVTDKSSKEPLAFVAIAIKGTSIGTYSDIDGVFNLSPIKPGDIVVFNFIGYTALELSYPGNDYWNVELERKPITLNEVIIRPGVNPAERIIQAAIDRKDQNDPEKSEAFTYDSYNKLVFMPSIDSLSMYDDSLKYNSLDTNDREVVDLTRNQYLFLLESVSQRKFLPPGKSEETIIASRVSGLKNPDFALLSSQLQSFSFYGEMVDILGNSYLSPLANGSVKKYLFIIEDTTYIERDTVFTISFRPRKGKNFTGMEGQLFINTNGYALQNVIAHPYDMQAGFSIRIQQQYEWVDNRRWFPMQLNSFIDMKTVAIGSWYMVGVGKSYVKNLKLNAPLRGRDFTPVTLQMDKLATMQPDSVWNKYREHDLDNRELKTYHVIDSLGKESNLDRRMQAITALATGKVAWGKISFDLDRIMRFNSYEGYRLGLGIHTNERLSKWYSVGGYYAYGFKDVHSKYGGDVALFIHPKRDIWIKALYENDVRETGGNIFDKPTSGFAISNLYPLFVSRMDRREKREILINARTIGNLTATVFTNVQYIRPFRSSLYFAPEVDGVSLVRSDFHINETGITLRWAPGEKLARMKDREIRLGGRWPVMYLKYTLGGVGFEKSDFDYTRIDVLVEKKFKIKNVGELSISGVAGKIPGDVPFTLLYNSRGTWDNFTVATPGAFETMRTNEFQHSEFVELHVRHNFRSLLFKRPKFQPQVQLVTNMIFGKMQYAERHALYNKSADKGFFESGIQIDQLYKTGISGFGIGVFYRYGANHLPNQRDNFAFKLSSTIAF